MSKIKRMFAVFISMIMIFSVGCSKGNSNNNNASVASSSSSSSTSNGASSESETLPEGQAWKDCITCSATGKNCFRCEDGSCTNCDGEGKKECGICHGKNECNTCDGKGTKEGVKGTTRDCPLCKSGECSRCDEGYLKCSICNGDGKCRNCDGERKCSTCDGKGRYIINVTPAPKTTPTPSPNPGNGGYNDPCPICNDTGRMSCDDCFGYGSCIYCDGVGYFESYIGGKINKKDCPECVGGKCSTCHGTREVRCAVCR